MTTFFTGDTHFGHKNIIKYCDRPFTDVRHMAREMIQCWNGVVGNKDEVWHLGDFGVWFGDAAQNLQTIFDQLKGQKHLILGNHDHEITQRLGWKSIQPYVELSAELDLDSPIEGALWPRITLLHYPMATWNHKGQGAIHLHGHCHGGFHHLPGRRDIGVDSWNFTPVPRQTLTERIRNEDGEWWLKH